MTQAGIPFEVMAPRIDELSLRDSLIAEGATPRNIADALAEMKSLRIAEKHPDRLVLGSDQILVLDNRLYAKPTSRENAAQHLSALSGQTHQLISAAVISDEGRPIWRHVETVSLTMRSLTPDAIDAYLDLTWPDISGCVGCYKLEAEGLRLFTQIRGDFYAGLGLPILPVLSYLMARGAMPA